MKGANLAFFFVAFITIVVGASLLTNMAQTISPTTTPWTLTNESLNISSVRLADGMQVNESVNLTAVNGDWVASSLTLIRINGTAFRPTTDYTVDYTNEVINIKNTTATFNYNVTNIVGINYQYYDANYIDDTGSRAIIPLILIMFAVGIALAVISYLKKDAEGVIG